MSKAVNDGLIEPKLVRPVEIKVRTLKTDAVPLAKQPRAVPSYIFGHKPTPEELAERAAEKSEPKVFELSKRGKKRAAAGQEMKARIVLDRLIAQFPDRVIKARSVERYVNWFVGRTMEILEGAVDSEWLTSLAKERIKEGVEIKHLHATARREFEAQYLEAA